MRCLSDSSTRALAVSSRCGSKAGVRSMSRKSFRLSSKLLLRQFIVAAVNVSLAATPTSVARKSSDSSSAADPIVTVPPSRTIRAVIDARPGTSAGSSDAPPLKVTTRFTRGNSRDGAR